MRLQNFTLFLHDLFSRSAIFSFIELNSSSTSLWPSTSSLWTFENVPIFYSTWSTLSPRADISPFIWDINEIMSLCSEPLSDTSMSLMVAAVRGRSVVVLLLFSELWYYLEGISHVFTVLLTDSCPPLPTLLWAVWSRVPGRRAAIARLGAASISLGELLPTMLQGVPCSLEAAGACTILNGGGLHRSEKLGEFACPSIILRSHCSPGVPACMAVLQGVTRAGYCCGGGWELGVTFGALFLRDCTIRFYSVWWA